MKSGEKKIYVRAELQNLFPDYILLNSENVLEVLFTTLRNIDVWF